MAIGIFVQSCTTPEKVIVEEPNEHEVEYTIKKIISTSTETTFSNIAKANRNKLLSILPTNFVDSILVHSNLSEIDLYYKKDQINSMIANASHLLYDDFITRINMMEIEHGEMLLMNKENTITNKFAGSHYDYLENKLREYLIREGNSNQELKQFWQQVSNKYNEQLYGEKVETRLPQFLVEPTLNYIFTKIENQEMSIRNNVSTLGDATAKKVFDFYIERYVYGDYKFE